MKLILSTTSPYSRKCRILVRETGLLDLVDEVESHPFEDDEELLRANPLGRVPCLVLDDGEALTESGLIADYLMEQAGNPWPRDLADKRLEALGSGLLDLAVARRVEMVRDEDIQSDYWIQRRERAIMRAVDQLETIVDEVDDWMALGPLTMAVALSYLDFRFPESGWRDNRPKLARLVGKWSERPSFIETRPPASS
ncbi:glutathione S-transferase N-terminal domain-containing protein [Maricaulis sp. CAU 1757]